MGNLRIQNVQVFDSTSIDITFTEELVPQLVTDNVSILADTPNTPDSEVLGVKVTGNTLSVSCQPLTPLASYFLQFQSTDLYPFISIHGDFILPQDGVTNRYLITGPLSPDNPVKNYLTSFLKENIYNLDSDNTIVSQFIQSLSITLARALYDIRQIKNENYLSFTVTDEQKVRGSGPFDRLNEEGAYQIIRIGKGVTASNATATYSADPFPSFPITLQRQVNVEQLTPSSQDKAGQFNVNTLTLNLSTEPVTKITSLSFLFDSINPNYIYDIETLGYQIKSSRYDKDFAFTYLLLEDNQIRINDAVLQDPDFTLDNLISVTVEYESKNLGIVVNSDTVKVTAVLDVTREVLPPIINIFTLAHAPVVDGNGDIPTLGGLSLLDPNNNTPGAVHPAFVNEIPFRLNGLPARPGQYSVDYATGTVYVYGVDLNNDGTGPYPPLATYKYLLTYNPEQDYVYDPDLLDLVALPLGNLVDNAGTIDFNFEEVLVPGVDYNAALHIEELTERVENRLLALNALRVKNAPITNVFRIYNETSGEIYTLNRWNNDKIYFRYNNPPRVVAQVNERATFNNVINELLSTNTTFTNTNSLRVFNIPLNNNLIISSTEDSIASSVNTSLVFSNGNIFVSEIWYNKDFTAEVNANRLAEVGQYIVDYVNGIVYVAVSSTQDFNLGTASYKNNIIVPSFPHLISVEDIYYRISPLNPKNKTFAYVSFDEGEIIPASLDNSDETALNNSDTGNYELYNGDVGIFIDSGFVAGVTNQVKIVRGLFEYTDLLNSTAPLNFANVSSGNGFNISVGSISNQLFDSVQQDVDGYFITINENIPYLSSNIDYSFSVIRTSDGQELWDGTGTIVPGNPLRLTLPGTNSPNLGDLVTISYNFTILNLSRVVVDYNKGDLYVDYTYVADELIVSYEYGDNVIDYRTSKALAPNTEYFVSYKAGALRDALLKNFGTLVNIPELSNFDVDFNRERYRDALMAALSSFIQGPTVGAIKNIGKTISHIEPEIIESIFQGWSLGNSSLYAQPIKTTGSFDLLPAKYGNGVLVNQPDQTISFPTNSNIRLEEGTFETWISPQWNGLDNDATLTFTITKDNNPISESEVFIGVSENHPEIGSDGKFSVTKPVDTFGLPNMNKDGIFIYYDTDASGSFNRWYVRLVDGYVSPDTSNYKIKIESTGTFYDVKSLYLPKPSNMSTFSGVNSVNLTIAGGSFAVDEGITFISDLEHYLLDFGKEKTRSRLSIFKDVSGYLNFRVYDKEKTPFIVSTDVSGWQSGELHHIAASWNLNTQNNRDEMHLFVDGLEVPNIIKYGQKLRPYLHEKFRTVDPEELVDASSNDIIASVDLHTTQGSTTVTSSINFDDYNIFPGNIIYIDEPGFSESGYTINTVSGQTLDLSTAMPLTLTDGKFSINRTSYTVTSDIDTAPNIAVSVIHSFLDGYDLSGTASTDTVSSATDFEAAGVLPGYLIRIDDGDLPLTVLILQVSGNTLVLDTELPNNLSGTDFWIYSREETELPGVRALRPDYSISKDTSFNNILTISNGVTSQDLILIRTLGINHRSIKRQYYVWSSQIENVLMTRMPPPISLDEAKITKIILPSTPIGPDNSTYTGVFTSNNLPTSQPTNAQNGRTISVTLSGTNTDFSTPVQVTISGVASSTLPVIETITFTDYGTLDFANAYISTDYINVVVQPVNPAKAALVVLVKEKYPMTYSEYSGLVPEVKYSYYMGGGYHLYSDSLYTVRDDTTTFSYADVGNYLLITSPIEVAGFYIITGISSDRKTLEIESTISSPAQPLSSFSGGVYQILNTTSYRSGLQGGYFTLQQALMPSTPYFLSAGLYELEYDTYDMIKFDPVNNLTYFGSDFNGHNQINAIMDQVKVYSVMLTDTRIGESIPANQRSITKDYNSLKALKSDPNTLMLLSFDTFPFENTASDYIDSSLTKDHFRSAVVVNENFGNSVVINEKPIILSNDGILDTRKEGTIEFWVNPKFDTGNDPVERYYFDAYGAIIEEVTSINNVSLKLSGPAAQILSVTMAAGDPRIDYFVGGKIEIDTQNAIREDGMSIGTGIVQTAKFIMQVMSVKIAGDLTGKDYFADGSVGPDRKTIYLGIPLPESDMSVVITYQPIGVSDKLNTQIIRLNRRLPYENSKVRVSYIPKGLQGDRISIFKDNSGFCNFSITASGAEYVVRAPTRWAQDTWHRVKATYKINGGAGHDELRLFLDGYEYTNILFGDGAVFGKSPLVMGASMPGDGYQIYASIKFRDPINELFIGSEYTGRKPIFSLIDNFRISNISRPLYTPFGESIDVNYSSNLNTVLPVTPDLYTTYLLDFGPSIVKNDDFALLKNRETGLFNFLVEIFDSFDIVKDSAKVQEVLEKLIKVLKPANSKVFIEYIG